MECTFSERWLESFHWLSYSSVLEGGICRYCILFPEQPSCRGGGLSGKPGVLVLAPYQKPYPEALGKDGILTLHEKSGMHRHATEKVDFFVRGFQDPSERIDIRLLKQQAEQEKINKEVLRLIVLAVEFLAKQGLAFRGNNDDKVDFSDESFNRGNFIATLQLLAKGNSILQNHLLSSGKNALHTSKNIQNEIIHIIICFKDTRIPNQRGQG